MERRLERRQAWAGGAKAEAERRFDAAHNLASQIPLGQPILVGHHSEKRHRRHLERIDGSMSKGCEALQRSEHHAAKADGIEAQLERSIFSDDTDAVEQLRARIAEKKAKA